MIDRFPGQYEGEKIVLAIRKHPVVYFKIFTGFLLTGLLPAFLIGFYFRTPLGLLLVCFYLLYAMLFALIAWFEEAFDLFLLTTERLIDFTQVSLLKRHIASTPLNKIEDTVGTVRGFMGTFLHYGDLDIKTAAGDATQFFMDRIPDPEQVAHDILEQVRKVRQIS